MTLCVKTGAQIFLTQYGEWVITDLMRTGNCFHFFIESNLHISRNRLRDKVHGVVFETGMPRRVGREMIIPENEFIFHGDDGVDWRGV